MSDTADTYRPRYGDSVQLGKGRVTWEVGIVSDDAVQLVHDRRRAGNDLGITYRYIPRDHAADRLTLIYRSDSVGGGW
ncbi:hypothetical protein [Nocardia asteroides]|uniref:hypothetical protein n=1 Tax=Nocardia asteroides TaxID=1824 RepID=UPI0033FBB634